MNVMCKYSDFWLKFINYLYIEGNEESLAKVVDVYKRYDKVFLSIEGGANVFEIYADINELEKNIEGSR